MVLKAWVPDLDITGTRNGPYFKATRTTRNPIKYEKNRLGYNPETRLCKTRNTRNPKKGTRPGTDLHPKSMMDFSQCLQKR